MMSERSLAGMQLGLTRLAKVQEQLSTGRILNRPSDSPIDTAAAMSLRKGLDDQQQFLRNTSDGLAWLTTADSTLCVDEPPDPQGPRARAPGRQHRRAERRRTRRPGHRDRALRQALIKDANTKYLDRPIFGGVTAGTMAYDDSRRRSWARPARSPARWPTASASTSTSTARPSFGPDGANLFDDLAAARDRDPRRRLGRRPPPGSTPCRPASSRVTSALSDVGSRTNRVEAAEQAAIDAELAVTSSLSEVENADLPKALMELKLQEIGLPGCARLDGAGDAAEPASTSSDDAVPS